MLENKRYKSFDDVAFEANFQGLDEVAESVIVAFLEGGPAMLTRIENAIRDGDAVRLHRAAHAFRGTVSSFYADRAVSLAAGLETRGETGSVQGANVLFDQLKDAVSLLLRDLRDYSTRRAVA